jgi:hypothetical protein
MNADKRSKGLTDIPEKLLKIAADIAERGNANLTRLTVLKKWFGHLGRLPPFAIWVASRALLARVNPYAPKVDRKSAKNSSWAKQCFVWLLALEKPDSVSAKRSKAPHNGSRLLPVTMTRQLCPRGRIPNSCPPLRMAAAHGYQTLYFLSHVLLLVDRSDRLRA